MQLSRPLTEYVKSGDLNLFRKQIGDAMCSQDKYEIETDVTMQTQKESSWNQENEYKKIILLWIELISIYKAYNPLRNVVFPVIIKLFIHLYPVVSFSLWWMYKSTSWDSTTAYYDESCAH